MSRKIIIVFLVLLAASMVGLVILDIRKNRPDARPNNPFSLNLDAFKSVDTTLVKYREVLNMELNDSEKRGIAFGMDRIWVIGENFLQEIAPDGKQIRKTELSDRPSCITTYNSVVYIGFENRIRTFDIEGKEMSAWPPLGDSSLLTSLAVKDSFLFAADAGKRRVLKYRTDGTLLSEFDGKREADALHGFIIPSPYFDLAIAPDGELWVVNPGNHAFENYTSEGRLRGYWNKSSADIDGFSGCCGPAQMAVLPDGSFVTSEKGIVRIKVHKASGELDCVVAPPQLFAGGLYAPDLAVGDHGEIYALDFDRKMIRVFERKLK